MIEVCDVDSLISSRKVTCLPSALPDNDVVCSLQCDKSQYAITYSPWLELAIVFPFCASSTEHFALVGKLMRMDNKMDSW